MNAKRVLVIVAFTGVLAGTIATSKPSDVDGMIRIGKLASRHVQSVLPDARRAAGPLAAFHAGDALPLEERVRIRVQADKALDGVDVTVVCMGDAGEIKLKGIVANPAQRQRAIELAESTAGVEKVIPELAIVEK